MQCEECYEMAWLPRTWSFRVMPQKVDRDALKTLSDSIKGLKKSFEDVASAMGSAVEKMLEYLPMYRVE